VKALGWSEGEGVGKRFKYGDEEGSVIGVLKDFHMHSLHQPIEPLMLRMDGNWFSYIAAKVRPDDLPQTLAFFEETMGRFTPYPFEYEFLDETFDQLYKTEIRLGETFGYFTLLALLIASLGLFGLAAFSAEQRTKEIGVRKVLGASVPTIVLLLSKEFTRLVVIAFVLAIPVTYIAMNRWLEDFAYRIEVSWPVFLAAGLAALVVALLSVGYQAFKAARVNPVVSLRYE
jgi:putative ABC transport system permease protein